MKKLEKLESLLNEVLSGVFSNLYISCNHGICADPCSILNYYRAGNMTRPLTIISAD